MYSIVDTHIFVYTISPNVLPLEFDIRFRFNTTLKNNKFAKNVAPVSSIDEIYEKTCLSTGNTEGLKRLNTVFQPT